MRNLIFLVLIFSNTASADEPWIAFWDENKNLRGFKDKAGIVRIKPRFSGFTIASKFNNIIAVMEEKNGSYQQYYLLKNGTKIGSNNMYLYDNSYDCESENTIRFRDKKTKKVGFYNFDGNIKIPAIYDNATSFKNGMAVAVKNAIKMCFNEIEYSSANRCEHWRWDGGETVLIDKENNILLTNFETTNELDFYSLKISRFASNKDYLVSYLDKHGRYYTFVDIKKNFKNWLKNDLLTDLSLNNLKKHSLDKINYWSSNETWGVENKNKYIKDNLKLISFDLSSIIKNEEYTMVLINGLNKYIYTGDEFKKYFNDCGESKNMKYPVLDLVINKSKKGNNYQNSFEFLKTESGFKLLSVTIKNDEMLKN